MDREMIFKIKFYATTLLTGAIVLVYVAFMLFSAVSFRQISKEYKVLFLEVTEKIEKADKLNLLNPVGLTTEKGITTILNNFGINDPSTKGKINDLNNIVIKIKEDFPTGRRSIFFRDDYEKIIATQESLNSLVKMAEKYSRFEASINLNEDKKKIVDDYRRISILRDYILNRH